MAIKKTNPLLESKKRKAEIERLTVQAKNIESVNKDIRVSSNNKIGRPRSKKTEKVTFVMEPADLKDFKRLCFESETCMSDYIKKWLYQELNR